MARYVISTEGTTKVWRNDEGQFPRYSVSCSRKNEDGSYDNYYQSVRFKNGVELQNGEDIEIVNAFPSFNVGSDGRKYPYWMITEFNKPNEDDSWMSVPDSDSEVVDW